MIEHENAQSEFDELVARVLQEATSQLFESHGGIVDASPQADLSDDQKDIPFLAAASGFTAENVRGSVSVILPAALASVLSPLEIGEDLDAASDWVGELCNQLLGRLKNKLIGYGVELQVSIPALLQGNQMLLVTLRAHAVTHCVRCPDGVVKILFHSKVEPELVIKPSEKEAQAEGDLLLFD